jgi:hypothetical protein
VITVAGVNGTPLPPAIAIEFLIGYEALCPIFTPSEPGQFNEPWPGQ